MRANPYKFFKLTTLPQHLYTWLSQRRSLYVALTAGAHPYSPEEHTVFSIQPRFKGLNTTSPPSPTRAHRTPTHAASADRSRNDPDPPLALLGGPVLDARPLGTCSTQHAPLALYQRVGRQGLQDGGGRCRAGLKRWRTVQRRPPAAALARDGRRGSTSEARRPRAHHEQCS